MRSKARWRNASVYLEINAKGIERQSVVPEVILCLLCKWCNESLNALIWYFTELIISSLLRARNSHICRWNSNFNDAISFFHAHLGQNFIFKSLTTEVLFSLNCIHFSSGLLIFINASEALKGVSFVHWARSPFQVKKFPEAMRLKARLTRCQRYFKRFDSRNAGLCCSLHF